MESNYLSQTNDVVEILTFEEDFFNVKFPVPINVYTKFFNTPKNKFPTHWKFNTVFFIEFLKFCTDNKYHLKIK